MTAYLARSWTTVLPLALVSILTYLLAGGAVAPTNMPPTWVNGWVSGWAGGWVSRWLPGQPSGLPRIGAAPPVALTTQDDAPLTLRDLAGKVVLITFIYTSCTDTCPLLTGKLAAVQRDLEADQQDSVHFLAVTVDPERDTPAVLRAYGERFRADPARWSFLTGAPSEVAEVTSAYGVFVRRTLRGEVDHGFLTSLIDRHGVLRVQYLGTRFDPGELLTDLRALLREW